MNIKSFIGNSSNCQYYTLRSVPNKCPFCHNRITANYLTAYNRGNNLRVIFECPTAKCKELFIVWYEIADYRKPYSQATLKKIMNGNPEETSFPESIIEISPKFEKIYNQAISAESYNLDEIAGVGLRKAFEFLIKDYLISQEVEYNEDDELSTEDEEIIENIQKLSLGRCIQKKIENPKIKEISKRTTWLGNDETHYVRKWEDKDIRDLKKLIKLTTYWIEHEQLSNAIILEMPEN